jgi:hypothetical protein
MKEHQLDKIKPQRSTLTLYVFTILLGKVYL